MGAERGLIALSFLIAGFAACGEAPPPGEPADAVRRFFAAVEAGDCAAARGELGSSYRAEVEKKSSCEEYINEMRRYPLEQVVSTTVDGRDRKAQLVRTKIRGRKTESVLRVQAEGGRWKIFSM